LKGWTARLAVKIVSFVLIIALCIVILSSVLASFFRIEETGVYPDVILTDLSTNQFFHDRNMNTALHHVNTLAYLGSEEAIRAGRNLRWFVYINAGYYYDEYYEDNFFSGYEITNQLRTPDGNYHYFSVEGTVQDFLTLRTRYEEDAIRQQLRDFQAAQ